MFHRFKSETLRSAEATSAWCRGATDWALDLQSKGHGWIQLPVGTWLRNDSAEQVVRTIVILLVTTRSIQLYIATGHWAVTLCCAAGKVTVGLALHLPHFTDFSGLTVYGLRDYERQISSLLYAPLKRVQ